MSGRPAAPQRLATVSDAPRIAALMRESILDIFPRFYDETQVASAAVHIGDLDMTLIEDGTYYVHEAAGEIVACGGWSRRDRLYTGSGDAEGDARLLDPAASRPAYERCSCARTGRVAGSAERSWTRARPPRGRRASRDSL